MASSVLSVSLDSDSKLQQLAPGTYCFHRSWGYGKIRDLNQDQGMLVIDFKTKKSHQMEFAYAVQSLVSLPSTHIAARKDADLAAVKAMAEEDALGLIRCCIESFGAQATADSIQAALVPDVLSEAGWKKWWDSAKRLLKKDGLFHVPSKKSEAFRQLQEKVEAGDEAVAKLLSAVGVEQLLVALSEVLKNWTEVKNPAIASEIIAVVDTALANPPKSKMSTVIELAVAREELITLTGVTGRDDVTVLSLVPTSAKSFAEALEKISGPRQVKLLRLLREQSQDNWASLLLQVLPYATARMADSVTTAFVEADRAEEVVEGMSRLISERNVSPDLLHWLCKHRDALYASLFKPTLMVAILSVLEKDQLAEFKKGTKLYDLVYTDKNLLATLLKDAALDDVRDVTRAVILSPVFQELDKRSVLGTIVKLFPEIQDLVSNGIDRSSLRNHAAQAKNAILIVSWDSLEKRRLEMEDLVTKKIPQNSKDIELARSYGDLRENHEFKSAKELQSVLMRRQAELEDMLARAQGTDFAKVDTEAVHPGTKVTVTEISNKKQTTYTILGAWDSDPQKGVISYLTALASAMMQKKVGDEIVFPREDGTDFAVRIDKIEGVVLA
jgi:transcription elongation factor GreA-like protein/transcription elongation GreA/GreB family factor